MILHHVIFLFSTDCNGEGNLAQKQHSGKKPAGSLQAGGFFQVFVWSVLILGLAK